MRVWSGFEDMSLSIAEQTSKAIVEFAEENRVREAEAVLAQRSLIHENCVGNTQLKYYFLLSTVSQRPTQAL